MIALRSQNFILLLGLLLTTVWADQTNIGNLFSTIPFGHDGTCANWGIADVIVETNTFKYAINALDSLLGGPLPNVQESVNNLNMASALFGVLYKKLESGELHVFKGQENLRKARG